MTTQNVMIATLIALSAAVSGCIDPTDQAAALSLTGEEEAAAGQTVRFEAAIDGNATGNATGATYLFDFGDGTTEQIEGDARAEAEHVFASGGLYAVSVDLLAGNDTIASARHTIHILEQVEHGSQAVASGPLPNQTATATWDVPVGDNATRVESRLVLENVALIGQSVVRIELVDGGGEVLASEEVTLDEGAVGNATVSLDAPESDLLLRIVADSGSATASGDSTVRYE